MFSSANFCITIPSPSHSHVRAARRPFPYRDSKRGNQFTLHLLLLTASRGSCRNDRLSKAPFAFRLKIDTKGRCTIYCRSFSLLKCLEVVKSTETDTCAKPKRGKRQSSISRLNLSVGKVVEATWHLCFSVELARCSENIKKTGPFWTAHISISVTI